jgi:hypothetical protein
MLLSPHPNAGQNRDIKIAKRSFENVSQVKYLGTALTNQNLTQEKSKRRLYSGSLLLFSPGPSVFTSAVEKVIIRICNAVIFPVVLYGCET